MYKWGNIPALKFALFLVLGILIGSQIYFNGYLIITIIISLLILIFICSKKENTKILFSILSFLVIIFCGIFKSNIDFYGTDEHSIKYIGNKYLSNEVSHEIIISGIVKDYPEKDTSKIKFVFECSKILGTDTTEINGMIMVSIKKNRYNPGKDTVLEIDQGDYLELRGNLAEPLESRNPGEFNYKKYLYLNNIYKTFFVNGYDNVNKNNQIESESFFNKFVASLKKYSIENINNLNKGDGGAFLLGLVVGERDKIT